MKGDEIREKHSLGCFCVCALCVRRPPYVARLPSSAYHYKCPRTQSPNALTHIHPLKTNEHSLVSGMGRVGSCDPITIEIYSLHADRIWISQKLRTENFSIAKNAINDISGERRDVSRRKFWSTCRMLQGPVSGGRFHPFLYSLRRAEMCQKSIVKNLTKMASLGKPSVPPGQMLNLFSRSKIWRDRAGQFLYQRRTCEIVQARTAQNPFLQEIFDIVRGFQPKIRDCVLPTLRQSCLGTIYKTSILNQEQMF